MNEGYIKIDRRILNWEWYSNINTKVVFLHILLRANWQDGKFEGINIPRGSLVTSYAKLAEETTLSVQSVRTAINHLKSTGELTVEQHAKFSVISIKNYGLYQDTNKVSNKQLTSYQQATNKQLTTIEEIKKERNKELKKIVPKGTTKESLGEIINQYVFSEKLSDKVNEWLAYKSERQETYKPTGLTALLRKISQKVDEYGENPVIILIDECMANGWRGIIWDKLGKETERQRQTAKKGLKNYEERDWDFDELERIKRAELMENSKRQEGKQ